MCLCRVGIIIVESVVQFWPFIMKGLALTIELSLSSICLAIVLGLLGAWAKLSQSHSLQKLAGLYTTIVRGIPDLVVMLFVFYGGQTLLNMIGESTSLWEYLELNSLTTGIVSIGFIFGAYMTETFRGAYLSISRGQIESGIACGMNRRVLFFHIIGPQLVRYALPSFTNNWLTLMKTTALVSVIGLEDVVYNSLSAGRATQEPFAFLLTVFAIYLGLTLISDVSLRFIERKYCTGFVRGV